jgi:ribosome-associated protein
MDECLLGEVDYRTSRASGPGGQHVNKTETRVELIWEPETSGCLTGDQKRLVHQRLASRLTEQGLLIISSDRYRSQIKNKEEVQERFLRLIRSVLITPRKRHPTRPTSLSREERLRTKKLRGEIKRLRKNPPEN